MKTIKFLTMIILVIGLSNYVTAQCLPFGVNHSTTNGVAPVDKMVNYQVDIFQGRCWLTQNLGADVQATAKNDIDPAAAGWYWQFNRRQGYTHDGASRTPDSFWTTIIDENSDWLSTNDPCTRELGEEWRIPTYTEWRAADRWWWNSTYAYNSKLKLHAAGFLYSSSGELMYRGQWGAYWSSTQWVYGSSGRYLYIQRGASHMTATLKSAGQSIRCLK